MIKFVSNRIFTLIETLLLLAFSILMFFIGDKYLHIFIGVALLVYIVFVVLSKVVVYRGIIQMIAMLEFFTVTTLAVFVIVDKIHLPSGNAVNFSVGLAMWFRATTEILHSYHGSGEKSQSKSEFSAWKLFFYILLVSFGTFVATTTLFSNDFVRYVIAGVTFAGTIMMGLLTYCNFRDYRIDHPKVKKIKTVKAKPAAASPEVASENSVKKDKVLSDSTVSGNIQSESGNFRLAGDSENTMKPKQSAGKEEPAALPEPGKNFGKDKTSL